MKKLLIGSLVGGILIFLWQFLSWDPLQLHYAANQYTDKQDAILQYLGTQLNEDGQYIMPNAPKDASADQRQALMNSMEGKPWAIVAWHKDWHMNMTMNIIRGLIVNIIMVAFFCWILAGYSAPRFSTIFVSSLFVGMIVFLNAPYTQHIWYYSFDLMANLADALIGWGLCGIWLGWWYSRK